MNMTWTEYFEEKRGIGVLATADTHGKVDAAMYGRPHFFDDETLAFIAADRLTRANLQSNPHAVYLFKEADRYEGRRFYLTKIREEKNSPLIEEMRRKKHFSTEGESTEGPKYLIFFHLDRVLSLTGKGD
jgi:hypothetical protein